MYYKSSRLKVKAEGFLHKILLTFLENGPDEKYFMKNCKHNRDHADNNPIVHGSRLKVLEAPLFFGSNWFNHESLFYSCVLHDMRVTQIVSELKNILRDPICTVSLGVNYYYNCSSCKSNGLVRERTHTSFRRSHARSRPWDLENRQGIAVFAAEATVSRVL